jgi:hypothetical protein
MGKGWWSDQWGRGGSLTNGERVVVSPMGKGDGLTNGDGVVV